MDNKRIEALRDVNYDNLILELTNACRSSSFINDDAVLIVAAYVLLHIQQNINIKYDSLGSYINTSGDPERRCMFFMDVFEGCWDALISLKDKYDEDTLLSFVLFYESPGKYNHEHTPVGVSKLAARIMDIQPGDSVADFGTGKGGFIRECMAMQPFAKYYGNDINTIAIEIASIRAQLLGGDIRIVQEDIFDMKDKNHKFDVAFANYSFGMRAKDAWRNGFNKFEEYAKDYPDFSRAVSLDWLFNKKVYSSIVGPRRAVCIMTYGSTWNTLDSAARRHFISGGAIEAVIALPNNIFQNTSIGTVMVVFSHGNTSVMMIDARDMCTAGRRFNTITDKNIDEILTALSCEGKHSKRISNHELTENDYVLNPVRYMTEAVSVVDGVPFDSVIKRITRGAPLNAATLDELASPVTTDTQYLMLSNIKDGIIDDDLPYLKGIEQRQEKYCIKDKSLIISKNGYPYKVAVAEVPEGRRILANGNLFIIELDENKVDPYFIKAYLESDIGISTLKSITVGATIPNIGIEQLKRITVPCPPQEEQKAIVDKYLILADEIKLLRRKMNKATSDLKHLFDEDREG